MFPWLVMFLFNLWIFGRSFSATDCTSKRKKKYKYLWKTGECFYLTDQEVADVIKKDCTNIKC